MENTSTSQAVRTVGIDLASATARRFRQIAILGGFCVILLFLGLSELPFYNRGEPREGLVVWEMYSSGNWILPAVNGEYIPFKPPLFHWLALLVSHLFGRVDEFTLRFPSALLATTGVLLTYQVARRLWGQRAGIVAGVVLATCAEWWQAGTDTQVDMTLAFFVSTACFYFDSLYHERDFGVLKALGLPLLLGLATLAKGPVGVALPGITFLIFLALRRDFAFVGKLHPVLGGLVFLVIVGSWYAAALWQGGPAFFLRQIIDENIRTAAGNYGHHQPVYYYLPIFLENSLPWSLFIPCMAVFCYQRRHKLGEERLLFYLVWLFSVLIFFTGSLGKRGVYILPLYPAFALLFGAWWRQLEQKISHNALLARWITCAFGVVCLAGTCAIALYYAAQHGWVDPQNIFFLTRFEKISRFLQSRVGISTYTGIFAALFVAGLGALVCALFRRNWIVTFSALSLMTLAVDAIIKRAFIAPVAFERTMKPFVLRVNQMTADHPLLFYRDGDYGVMFYARRHIPAYAAQSAALKPPFFLLMWEEDWAELGARRDLKRLDISEGLGPAGRHRLTLVEYNPKEFATEPLPIHCPRHGSPLNTGSQCASMGDEIDAQQRATSE